jgi:hypothetical protein
MDPSGRTLLIACGALAREILALRDANGWERIDLACLPAHYHNTPEAIPAAVRAKIHEARATHERIAVVYGDCGTGGGLDAVLSEEGIARIPGPHCYEFLAGARDYAAMMEAEPGTFFLTDYMARHFDKLVIEGLWLDRHPELLADYFGNYRRLVYLAQSEDPSLQAAARRAAVRLGLAYEYRFTGMAAFQAHLQSAMTAAPPAATLATTEAAAEAPSRRNLALARRRAQPRRRAAAGASA